MSDAKSENETTSDQAPAADQAPGATATEGIDDEQLPEDLQPTEENPLAQPLDPDDEGTKDLDELDMDGGNPAEEWDDEQLED